MQPCARSLGDNLPNDQEQALRQAPSSSREASREGFTISVDDYAWSRTRFLVGKEEAKQGFDIAK
jgi:hypothetical protein